jgi:2-oxoglutarate ferredoxin oxidoreductase subunit alpha
VLSQRSGPSTGIPTKMEQADLLSVLYAGHGEFPRCIIAPRNISECFDAAVKAFNIADKYQLPVILMIDFALSEIISSVDPFDMNVPIERGKIWSEPTSEYPEFKRFQLSKDGISPRAFPGTKDAIHVLVGAEHDEKSHSLSGNRCGLPSSGIMHEKQIEKRFKKLSVLQIDMDPPTWFGPEDASFTILCWGSLEGACKEAAIRLNALETGTTWNVLSFKDLHPLPVNKIIPELKKIQTGIMVEVNHTSQFEQQLFLNTKWRPYDNVHIMTGETPTAHEIIPKLIEKTKLIIHKKKNSLEISQEVWF